LSVGEGLHHDLRDCSKVFHGRGLAGFLARSTRGSVVQTGQQHLVAVGVDVVEGLLLMLGQGVEREVEENRKNQTQERCVEGGPQPAGDVVDGSDDLADVLDVAEAHPTDRVGKPDNRPDEPQEWDRPQKGAQQNVAAHDPGAVDGGLAAHHAADLGHVLADLEELEGLADAVDHEAVPEFDRQAVDVVDEGADILRVDCQAQVFRQHVEQHCAPLQLELEHLQVTDRRRPEEEEGVGKADCEVLVKQVGQRFPRVELCGGFAGGCLEKIDEREPSSSQTEANPEAQERIGIRRILLFPNVPLRPSPESAAVFCGTVCTPGALGRYFRDLQFRITARALHELAGHLGFGQQGHFAGGTIEVHERGTSRVVCWEKRRTDVALASGG
jgi:hypothetical protein